MLKIVLKNRKRFNPYEVMFKNLLLICVLLSNKLNMI